MVCFCEWAGSRINVPTILMAYTVSPASSHSAENRQNRPGPGGIPLVGDNFARDTQRTAQSDQRQSHEHEFRAPEHPHPSKRRQDPLSNAEDHHRNESNGQRVNPDSSRSIPEGGGDAEGRRNQQPSVGHAHEVRKREMARHYPRRLFQSSASSTRSPPEDVDLHGQEGKWKSPKLQTAFAFNEPRVLQQAAPEVPYARGRPGIARSGNPRSLSRVSVSRVPTRCYRRS